MFDDAVSRSGGLLFYFFSTLFAPPLLLAGYASTRFSSKDAGNVSGRIAPRSSKLSGTLKRERCGKEERAEG
jgi:hypothetical protein